MDLQAALHVDRGGKKRMATGLSAVYEKYPGKPLDKVNSWSLTERQKAYAALNAWVCVAVYQMVMPETILIVTGNTEGEGCAKLEKI